MWSPFDSVLRIAIKQGNTSDQFMHSSYEHARSSWFWIIVFALVWWFVSFGYAAIPLSLAIWSAYNSIGASTVSARLKIIETTMKNAGNLT